MHICRTMRHVTALGTCFPRLPWRMSNTFPTSNGRSRQDIPLVLPLSYICKILEVVMKECRMAWARKFKPSPTSVGNLTWLPQTRHCGTYTRITFDYIHLHGSLNARIELTGMLRTVPLFSDGSDCARCRREMPHLFPDRCTFLET